MASKRTRSPVGLDRHRRVDKGRGWGSLQLLFVLVSSGGLAAYAGLTARDVAVDTLRGWVGDAPSYDPPPPRKELDFN